LQPAPPLPEWRPLHWRPAVAVALAVAVAALLVAVGESTYRYARESLVSLSQRDDARLAVQLLVRRLLDAESAQRGYLLTGRAQDLQPHADAEKDVAAAVARLRAHQRSDAVWRELVDEVALRSDEKLTDLRDTLTLHGSGRHDAWRERLLTDIGREKMEAVRNAADRLLAAEVAGTRADNGSVMRTLDIGRVGLHGATLLGLLWFLYFVRRSHTMQITQREQAQALQRERDGLEAQVKARTLELAELNRNLQLVHDEERAAIARTLHDQLGALLTAAKLDLTRLQRQLALAPSLPAAAVTERMAHLGRTLDEGIRLKRFLIEELMPSALHHLGLGVALELMAQEFSQRTGIAVALDGQSQEADDAARVSVFRLVQEALHNVETLASAQRVQVQMQARDGMIEIRIEDDGRGLDLGGGSPSARSLKNLRYRIEMAGGSMHVVSAPTRGTGIDAKVPAVAAATPLPPSS
jgi:signal transduction histidine kinase